MSTKNPSSAVEWLREDDGHIKEEKKQRGRPKRLTEIPHHPTTDSLDRLTESTEFEDEEKVNEN